ncbi:RING/FYVE/PHD zinc finger superfamily protein [Thalictrum thalictroides]|uniref:RING/FYVE/PHD zinc finger superfamily protein n=1 Tax=Thalictrum thalictroides TaxID=46969 RepID=A0A7J6V6J8_THATH|nr:RING/FYVE/PHD zinc finger superfamily protein [Thalictrum thalictroides]
MASTEKSNVGVEEVGRRRSVAESDGGSECFSDAEDRSWHSPYNSNGGRSYEDYRLSDHEIGGVSEPRRSSSVSDCSVEVDLESGVQETKVHLPKVEKDCRICHLTLESTNSESGIAIELGCACKADLAAAHKHCAEAWFKIKGNKTCEICGSVARNVVGANETDLLEQWSEQNNTTTAVTPPAETRSFWHGHRFLNFLLACMVFAFVISWLFHFNVPS